MAALASDGLVVTLPSDREVVMTRIFAAPRHLVFDAWTRPEHLVQWYGRRGWTLTVCEVDLRPGGGWRFVKEGPDGATMGISGVFREIEPPRRLVATERFDGDEYAQMGGETLCTLVLEEHDGHTAMTRTIRYPSRAARDAALRTPMAEGTASSFDRLAEQLPAMAVNDVAGRYRRLSAAFADKIARVPADRWTAPTPCTGWSVRDLVHHVVEMHEVHLRLAGRPVPAGPSVDEDPLGAFHRVRERVEADLADPVRAQAEVHNRFGQWTFAELIDHAVGVDLAVHGWDLARATGQEERIDPVDLPHLWRMITRIGDEALRPVAYAPALEPPPDADEQTRLLAYLGRRA